MNHVTIGIARKGIFFCALRAEVYSSRHPVIHSSQVCSLILLSLPTAGKCDFTWCDLSNSTATLILQLLVLDMSLCPRV